MALVGLIVAAWLSAAACAVLSGWHVRRLAKHQPPSRAELGAKLRDADGSGRGVEFHEELRERADEAERALALATMLPRSLARVSLATGTALALTSLAQGIGSGAARVPGGMLEFLAGFTGLIVCSVFGRQAKTLAAESRRGWRDAMKMAGRQAPGEWTQGRASG